MLIIGDHQLQIAFQLIQVLSLGLVKISVLLFYRRIFCNKSTVTAFNVITRVWIVVVLMWTIAFFFALIFPCDLRFYAMWSDSENLLTKCINTIKLEEGFVASDFITDIVTLAMPLSMASTNPGSKPRLTISAGLDAPHEHSSKNRCHRRFPVGRSVRIPPSSNDF